MRRRDRRRQSQARQESRSKHPARHRPPIPIMCHSTVDNSAPALCAGQLTRNPRTGCVGHRIDGWPNRDLNSGAIVALAANLSSIAQLLSTDQATVRKVLNSGGPGKFEPVAPPLLRSCGFCLLLSPKKIRFCGHSTSWLRPDVLLGERRRSRGEYCPFLPSR